METIGLILFLILIFGIFVYDHKIRSINKGIDEDEERIASYSVIKLPVIHANEVRFLRHLDEELDRRGGPIGEGSANGDIDNNYKPLPKHRHLKGLSDE